jgi:16S rRNA (cytosine1402-N4)-methyltransferase
MEHVPVLPEAVISHLAPAPGEVILDCTLGRGGHARLILPRLQPGGRYIGLDVDPANIQAVQRDWPQVQAVRANFADARAVLDSLGIDAVDGLLADMGFASPQVDDPARGLSFMHEGPLDMRLDPDLPVTAGDLVNGLVERELADVIYRYGEERFSRRIARKIAEARAFQPIKTTGRLAELCAQAYGRHRHGQRIDPATGASDRGEPRAGEPAAAA